VAAAAQTPAAQTPDLKLRSFSKEAGHALL